MHIANCYPRVEKRIVLQEFPIDTLMTYRTTIPADRLTSVFPQVEANRSTIPWLIQASREVETAFLKQVPFEVLNDEWAAINTAKGWNKSYRSRTFKEKVNLLQKELSDKPSR